jgi:hypothetical protein
MNCNNGIYYARIKWTIIVKFNMWELNGQQQQQQFKKKCKD